MPQPSHKEKVAVILTALEVETRAVLRQLGPAKSEAVSGTQFLVGAFGGWKVTVAEVGPGTIAAAAASARALHHYAPEIALFVGVAGGVKDVRIGDVVVGTKVYGYETGKDTTKGFQARPDLMRSAYAVEQAARALRLKDDWRSGLDGTLKHQAPGVVVAPIAAGEKVVSSTRSATAKFIKQAYGDAVAVEMEGRGFLEGVHISAPVQGGVVRAISDLLSGKANADRAGSQKLAADAASAFAFAMLKALDAPATPPPPPKFLAAPTTFTPGAYFAIGEVLARVGEPQRDEVLFSCDHAPDAYLRLIPIQGAQRPIPLATLHDLAGQAALLAAPGYGGLSSVNKYGAIKWQIDRDHYGGPAPLHRATQIFPNGEVWSFTDRMVIRERGHRPAWVPLPSIAAEAFEKHFYNALHGNVRFAVNNLGLTFPCEVEFGVIGIAGAKLMFDDEQRGPVQCDEVLVRATLTDGTAASLNGTLLAFFNEVHDKTGYARPATINGFPPGPP
jgi:nucleoside phosphorylase